MLTKEEIAQSILIRQAEAQDAKAVIGLLRHLSRNSPFLAFDMDIDVQHEAQLIQAYQQSPDQLFLVGEIDGQLMALANLHSPPEAKLAHSCEMGLAIIKEYWGYGIGSIFMEEVIHFAQTVGKEVMYIEVVEANQAAIRLYKNFAFEEVGRLSRRLQVDNIYYDTLILQRLLKSAN